MWTYRHKKSCFSSRVMLWTDYPPNECEMVQANCVSSSFPNSQSRFHFFFMTVMISWRLQYFIRTLWGSCPSAAGQGPPKDGEDRWMAWRKVARGRDDWMLPVVHDQKTVSEGIKDSWIWCRRYRGCAGHHCRQGLVEVSCMCLKALSSHWQNPSRHKVFCLV